MRLIQFFRRISEDADFAEETMQISLRELCEYGDWSLGHYFVMPENSVRELISRKQWFSTIDELEITDFKELTERLRVFWGADIPGRVLASGSPEWFSSLDQLEDSPRIAHAKKIGMKSAFGFPVIVDQQVVAIFEMFSTTERLIDHRWIEIGGVVGLQVARAIERDRSATELVRAKQAWLDASAVKSNFLAQVSHEIRTPLNAILGMSQFLLSSLTNQEHREFAESIRTSGDSLLRIVNDILDISKMKAGKFEIQNGDFRLKAVLRETLNMLEYVSRGKGIELSVHIDPNLPEVVRGDAGRLRQILLNLVGNAIKFTDEGSVTVRVLCEDHLSASVGVRFEVEDSGIGIPDSLRSRLFEVFTQADNSSSRKYGGSGLGLSISKRLVELMGGEIGFQSQEGVGSIFWFRVGFENGASVGLETAVATSLLNKCKQPVVLVVEDNELNQRVMVRLLETLGFLVHAVASGGDAVSLAKGREFDLIFMDCQMPELDGYAATQMIREWEQSQNRPPTAVIAVTANAIQGDRERCLRAGMSDYLSKPIDAGILASKAGFWLSQTGARPELDPQALERVLKMDGGENLEFLLELVILFEKSSPGRIEKMHDAARAKDGAALAREAHSLKSSSANLGVSRVSSICQKLDELGRSARFDGIDETVHGLLDELDDAYARACVALRRVVQRPNSI